MWQLEDKRKSGRTRRSWIEGEDEELKEKDIDEGF